MTANLADILGHTIRNESLLEEALTHPSVEAPVNYQRLEFLGDRVLGLIIAAALFERFKDAPEGELATRYNALVRRETLAGIARQCGLDAHVRLSQGERESGGRTKPAILADVVEAVIGALYLDGGIEVASAFIDRWWRPYVEEQKVLAKDPKTELQEWVQARGYPTPVYEEVGREGPPHAPVFTMRVRVGEMMTGEGVGRTKQAAEQAAALEVLGMVGSGEAGEAES